MMVDWVLTSLGEFCSITMGQSPAGAAVNRNADGLPLLNGPTEFGPRHPVPVQWASHWSKEAEAGDLLFCVRGSTTGRMDWADQKYAIGRGIASIRGKNPSDTRFARAVIDLRLAGLLQQATGSTFPNLSRGQLSEVDFLCPPKAERERIAGMLGAFDDLIETNRRLARDLMSLMFEQYGVLARDQPLTTFGTVARLVRDQWKPGSEGPDLYLGLEHFATDGAGLSGIGSSSSVQSVSLRFARGDVLYGKLRPYFRKVARPGFDGLCSSEVWVLRAQEGYPQSLVHALAHSPRFSEVAMAGSGGTRMPRADWKQVSTLPVPDLGSSALSQADLDGLEALWRTACELDDESHDLARQRDELLPLLMSGKVRVREANDS